MALNMDKGARYVWIDGENKENTWLCFVKRFNLPNTPEKAVARIAVDSKYWLYINGDLAVFEGGVKRGPTRDGAYYDEINIAAYLRNGENTIAVLVWYFGKSGFSHKSSGTGSLWFEADIDGHTLASDASWRVKKHPSYVEADEKDYKANFRLAESNIYYDASTDIGDWFMPSYDVSDWAYADEINKTEKLSYRIIPQFKNYGIKEYLNSSAVNGFTAKEDTILRMKLPYNLHMTPYLKVTAPAGKRICIKSDTYDDDHYDTKSIMAVYYTKDGLQEYESPGWINGEEILYAIPAGVTVHELKYRETGYDTEFKGSFECDDEFLNALWQKSLRTLYVTMRDTFMDCPDRERTQWWGDVNVEMQMMMYCLDKKALLLYKKGADTLVGWAEDGNGMLTVVPSGTEQFELPFQNLAGIWGFWYYYEYTGDAELLRRVYSMAKDYLLNGYKLCGDGLISHRKGSWDWLDWGDNADMEPMENAWYYMALKSTSNIALLLGFNEDIAFYSERLKSIEKNYGKKFLKNGCYYFSTANGKPDDRANALAVLSGLAPRKQYGGILNILKTTENSSPYMEKYVLDALCEMGYIDEAVSRMKKRYREMVEYDYSTLWEYWNTDGTLNHAWSGGPLVTMSKYIAGIRPMGAGYSRFEIKPYMGRLNYIKCVVPSMKGDIKLEIKNKTMAVEVPEGAVAEVYTPDGSEKRILEGGEYIIEIR